MFALTAPAITAPVITAATSRAGHGIVSSLLVRGLIIAIVIGVAWYYARRRGSGSGRD